MQANVQHHLVKTLYLSLKGATRLDGYMHDADSQLFDMELLLFFCELQDQECARICRAAKLLQSRMHAH